MRESGHSGFDGAGDAEGVEAVEGELLAPLAESGPSAPGGGHVAEARLER